MRRILTVDGGGMLGGIPAAFLAYLEPVKWDLILGTSTGSILGAFLASGKPASEAAKLYRMRGPEMFGSASFRNLWIERPWMGKYSREAFVRELSRWIDPELKMLSFPTKFIATSDSLVDGRTHFFKSDDARKTGSGPADQSLRVLDVIARSGLSAPLYFRPVDDPEGRQVWIDGGTGISNCTLGYAVEECVRRGWHLEPEGCRILSLGCGWSDARRSYESAARRESWGAIQDFVTSARRQAETDQIRKWEEFEKPLLPSIHVVRANVRVRKEINVLDGAAFMPEYEEAAKHMIAAWAIPAARLLGLGA